jgi:hypothetical protein
LAHTIGWIADLYDLLTVLTWRIPNSPLQNLLRWPPNQIYA